MANKITLSDKIKSHIGDTGWIFHEDVERDVEEFIKEERKILDNWAANLKRDEIGGRELGIEDLLRLSKKLDELAGDALVSNDEVKE